MTYAMIYEHGLNEQGRKTRSVYVPDLPGCVSAGETREAIELHLEGLRDEDLPMPRPSSEASAVHQAAAQLSGARPSVTLLRRLGRIHQSLP